jgi:hypothetical protein
MPDTPAAVQRFGREVDHLTNSLGALEGMAGLVLRQGGIMQPGEELPQGTQEMFDKIDTLKIRLTDIQKTLTPGWTEIEV